MKKGVTAPENVQATELQIHQMKAEDKRVQHLFLQPFVLQQQWEYQSGHERLDTALKVSKKISVSGCLFWK